MYSATGSLDTHDKSPYCFLVQDVYQSELVLPLRKYADLISGFLIKAYLGAFDRLERLCLPKRLINSL